jgi:hypothetical protein
MESKQPHPLTTRPATCAVWLLWAIAAVVILTMVGVRDHGHPGDPQRPRSMYYIYPRAASDWWHGNAVYDTKTKDEFQYLPQAAILHTPFWLCGEPAGDIVWRAVGLALLLSAIWRLAKLLPLPGGGNAFPVIALLTFAPSLASLQNGQANLPLAGLLLHAALCLYQQRWWSAGILLCLSVAVKPTALPMFLLAGAVYPKLRGRLAVCFLVTLALPYLTQAPAYATEQYRAAFVKMAGSAAPERATWEWTEIHDAIGSLTGWNMPRNLLSAIEAGAAVGLFVLCVMAARRLPAFGAAIFLWATATCYIMLFNPRNETNSFVIVTPAVALAAILAFMQGRSLLKWSLILITIGFSCDGWAHRQTNPWLKPMVCAIFMVIVIVELFRKSGLLRVEPSQAASSPPLPQAA